MRNLPAAALAAALTLAASPGLAGSIDRMTAAELDARQAALDREAEQAFIENDRLFREAEEVARRYKVDVIPIGGDGDSRGFLEAAGLIR